MEVIFVIDPMCSWCWGFHPVIEELCQNHSKAYTFSLVVGGLRTKGQMAWTEESKRFLEEHWKAVQNATGQPFSFELLKRDEFEYDTYPACKAIVSVRELWGDEASFDYLSRIQEAFYTQGVDITDDEVLKGYVREEQELFAQFYHSERAEVLMQHDFSKARSMGANAFPSVVKIDNEGHMMCKSGYQSVEAIIKK